MWCCATWNLTTLTRRLFPVDQIPRSYIRWIGHPVPSKMRVGGSLSRASDARYSASNCQKRSYNFILSTITRFTMVELGWFPDQCVLGVQTHRVTCLYDVFVPVNNYFQKKIYVIISRGSPFWVKKSKKIFLDFSYFLYYFDASSGVERIGQEIIPIWPYEASYSRKNEIIVAFLTLRRAISHVRRTRQTSPTPFLLATEWAIQRI